MSLIMCNILDQRGEQQDQGRAWDPVSGDLEALLPGSADGGLDAGHCMLCGIRRPLGGLQQRAVLCRRQLRLGAAAGMGIRSGAAPAGQHGLLAGAAACHVIQCLLTRWIAVSGPTAHTLGESHSTAQSKAALVSLKPTAKLVNASQVKC